MRARAKNKPMTDMNVVPYIDVMLVLMVIFMITMPLIHQSVEVELPTTEKAHALDQDAPEPIIVSINKNAKLFLNIADKPNEPLEPQILAKIVAAEWIVAQENNQVPMILVKGDKAVNYEMVVQVMAMLQKIGIAKVGLMTDVVKV